MAFFNLIYLCLAWSHLGHIPPGLVQTGAYPGGLIQPGAYPRGFMQPVLVLISRVWFSLYRSTLGRQFTGRSIIPPGTELLMWVSNIPCRFSKFYITTPIPARCGTSWQGSVWSGIITPIQSRSDTIRYRPEKLWYYEKCIVTRFAAAAQDH